MKSIQVRTPVHAGARLDRLPIGPFHRRVLTLLGLGMFFDSFDNNLSASVLAAMLDGKWSTLEENSLFLSWGYFGLMLGVWFAGWLSDRYGRKIAYQFNLAVFGFMALLAACAPSMEWLIPIRFLMGIGMGAEYLMAYGLLAEFFPLASRARCLGIVAIASGVGVFLTALVAMAVIPTFGWRAMFVIGGVGTLWVWWLRRHLPESPRWLERVGRNAEAEEILQQIEGEAAKLAPLPPYATDAPRATPRKVPVSILFSRKVIGRTLVAILVNVTCLVGAYIMSGWMPTFFLQQGMSVTKSLAFNAAMMTGWVLGPMLSVYVADRFGPRKGVITFGLVCAALGAVYPFLSNPVAIAGCGMLLVAAVSLCLYLGLGGTLELFPTEYRFRGAGLAQTVGRGCLIASPMIIMGIFRTYGIGGVIGAVSGLYLFAALLLAVAGVETSKRSLESLDPDQHGDDRQRDSTSGQAEIAVQANH
ncbi:MFS transporter (plasmid) [Cupriavidus necator]|uniref:MFS transporter n=1 Tax=Cupriavidus necator TaxID=106590 RepID=A0A1U9V3Z5_CUPNE|nr:MFS transporter [Cupriavidus necator]AQV99231.1 MFS transporter [Cupriavidus necator]